MKVIVVLLALAAAATAERFLYAEVTLCNEKTKERLGAVLFKQNGKDGIIEIMHENSPFPTGRFKITVGSAKIDGHFPDDCPDMIPGSSIKFLELTVSGGKRTVHQVNEELTFSNTATIGRTFIVDHGLQLYKQNAKTKAYTAIAKGIVRRKDFVILVASGSSKNFGRIIFHQYGNVIEIEPTIIHLPSGNYSIVMREKENSGINGKSSRTPTILSRLIASKSGRFHTRTTIAKSAGINSLDEMGGYIEIRKISAASNAASGVSIAFGELK